PRPPLPRAAGAAARRAEARRADRRRRPRRRLRRRLHAVLQLLHGRAPVRREEALRARRRGRRARAVAALPRRRRAARGQAGPQSEALVRVFARLALASLALAASACVALGWQDAVADKVAQDRSRLHALEGVIVERGTVP